LENVYKRIKEKIQNKINSNEDQKYKVEIVQKKEKMEGICYV
jgi:hypothetical protein